MARTSPEVEMARWRSLPDDLDPRVREFTELLRRQLDRRGAGVTALADATGYSRSSWDRYLSGRLLPPRAAVAALAEFTGAQAAHLDTLWEFTERAWSRAESRDDETIETARVSEARQALARSGPPPGPSLGRRLALFGAGAAAVVLALAAVLAAGGVLGRTADGVRTEARPSRSPSPSALAREPGKGPAAAAAPPSGAAACPGGGCEGRDPYREGCGGGRARTAAAVWVGAAYVEVRYSAACGAAWARISPAGRGAVLTLGGVAGGEDAHAVPGATYTTMLAVPGPASVRACARLPTGQNGCTSPLSGTR